MEPKSFAAALRWHAQRAPERPSVTDVNGSMDRAAFVQLVETNARGLHKRGVRAGDIVSISLPNDARFLALAFAAWRLGAAPQPLSPAIQDAELSGIIAAGSPRVLVREAASAREDVDVIEPAALAAIGQADDSGPLPEVTPTVLRAPVSGGSTGRPKVVFIKGAAQIDPMRPMWPSWRIDDTHLAPGRLYHGAPFTYTTFGMLAGAHIVLMDRFDPEATLRLAEQHQANWMLLVPTMMHRIWRLGSEVRNSYDLGALREVFHTAAPCSAWLKRAWIEWLGGERILELYGATESRAVTIIRGDQWQQRPTSVGKPLPGTEIKICDENGVALPPGETGLIYMRDTAGLMPNYEYAGAKPQSLGEGWETVGDMGSLDEEGFLSIADRRTDMIVTGGINVYPAEIEAAIESHPAVRSSAVIGLPDAEYGARVHAIVDAPERVGEHELRSHLAGLLSKYKLPRSFEFVAESLRDDNGKVRRSRLREERLIALERIS